MALGHLMISSLTSAATCKDSGALSASALELALFHSSKVRADGADRWIFDDFDDFDDSWQYLAIIGFLLPESGTNMEKWWKMPLTRLVWSLQSWSQRVKEAVGFYPHFTILPHRPLPWQFIFRGFQVWCIRNITPLLAQIASQPLFQQ